MKIALNTGLQFHDYPKDKTMTIDELLNQLKNNPLDAHQIALAFADEQYRNGFNRALNEVRSKLVKMKTEGANR